MKIRNMGGFSLMEYLNDPQLVARFQRFFGVICEPPKPSSTTFSSTVAATLKENSTENRRVLRSASRKLSSDSDSSKSSNSAANNSKVDGDYEFDTASKDVTSTAISEQVNLATRQRQTKTNHSRSESSGSSGISSGVEDEDNSSKWSKDQIVTNKFWYYLFKFGTSLGDEVFYAFWFSFWFWNVDGAVGRRVVLLWGILMYIGQGLKDLIRMPRPSCPPVVRLETKWELEYGMPSTHAVVGAAVPFATIIFTASRYQYPIELGFIGAFAWCSLVCMSRLYLGMHSVLDIIAGLSLVGVLFVPVIPLVDYLDPIILQSEFGGIGLFLVGVLLCCCTPGGDRFTPARGDTFVILGSVVGLISGAWMNYQLGIIRGPPLDPPYPVIWPSYSMLGLSLLRLMIGLSIVVATRAIIKLSLYTFFHTILKIPKRSDLNNARKIEVFAELSQKYISYCVIGFNIVYLAPAAFRLAGIERPTFHTEV